MPSTITRAFVADGDSGTPLPEVYTKLEAMGARFRRGEVHLVAGPPGAGKSVLALTLAIRSGVPTLYFSPDTNSATMMERIAATLTGQTLDQVRESLAGSGRDALLRLAEDRTRHVKWCFDMLDTGVMAEELMAYAEVWGDWPSLIIVDNLLDFIDPEFGDGWEASERALEHLKRAAQETGAAVVVLHHVTGEYVNGDRAIPLSGIKGQLGRIPELVLTVRPMGSGLAVDIVKNRHGEKRTGGGYGAHMFVDLSRMRVNDVRHNKPEPDWFELNPPGPVPY